MVDVRRRSPDEPLTFVTRETDLEDLARIAALAVESLVELRIGTDKALGRDSPALGDLADEARRLMALRPDPQAGR